MSKLEIKTVELDGNKIAYTNESVFAVQVGRHSKGAYKTKYSFTGDIGRAVFYYRCINIGEGYKKRLVCWTLNKPVLAKAAS